MQPMKHLGIFAHLRHGSEADKKTYPKPHELWDWERRLDESFTGLVETNPLQHHSLISDYEIPKQIPWRALVGCRFLDLDGLAIHVSLGSEHRVPLLPTIAMNLALLGAELPYFDDWERCFLPCDDELVCDWLAGLTVDLPDKKFHETLSLLNSKQRSCIADFVDWHFGRYVIARPDCLELLAAHAHLCKIWREG